MRWPSGLERREVGEGEGGREGGRKGGREGGEGEEGREG